MRKTPGILAASALVLTLAACAAPSGPAIDGGSPVDPGRCTPVSERGGLAADVEASGDFGATPLEAEFPTPLVSRTETSSAVLDAGEGPVVGPNDNVAGSITILDGVSGTVLTQTNGVTIIPLTADDTPFFRPAVCATVGSRIATVGTSSVVLGEAFVSAYGIDPEMTVVSVLDVAGAYLSRAQGAPQLPQNGLPTVSLAANGQPGLSFTNAEPPSELRIETLIAGNGTEVQDGDTVLVQYTGVIWDSREVFDSSWDKGAPAQFPTTGVVEGFSKALVGHRVGSQVLAAIPPAQGYGDNPPQGSGIGPDDTLVFVIDILGIVPATGG